MTAGRTSPTLEERQAMANMLKRLSHRLGGFENINHRILADVLHHLSGNVLCAADSPQAEHLTRIAETVVDYDKSRWWWRRKDKRQPADKLDKHPKERNVLSFAVWRKYLIEDRGWTAKTVERLKQHEWGR